MADKTLVKSGVVEEDLSDYVAPTETELDAISLEKEREHTKITIDALKAERDSLAEQLAKALTLGDATKTRIVTRIIKKYPEDFEGDEFDSAFEEESEKTEYHK